MTLGILVNTKRYKNLLMGLVREALNRGHSVMLFFMDEGTQLLEDESVQELHRLSNMDMSFCEHSAARFGINSEAVPEGIISGSQYNNARMIHDADKVIVL